MALVDGGAVENDFFFIFQADFWFALGFDGFYLSLVPKLEDRFWDRATGDKREELTASTHFNIV